MPTAQARALRKVLNQKYNKKAYDILAQSGLANAGHTTDKGKKKMDHDSKTHSDLDNEALVHRALNEEEGGGGESNVTAGVEKTELPIDMKRKRKEEADDRVDEAFSSLSLLEGLQRGESRGRFYKDSQGRVHDDEGNVDDGHVQRRPKTSAPKHYHQVPFAKKDEAKKEGMRFDGQTKKWYHTDAAKSKASAFKKH